MKRENMNAYLTEFGRIKKEYGNRLECFSGLEIDYLSRFFGPSTSYFQELPLDFRIGSIHFLPDHTGHIRDIDLKPDEFAATVKEYFNGDAEGIVKLYADQVISMVDAGGIDFVGHCDKISYSASFMIPGLFDTGWFNDLMENFFGEIAKSGIMLEVNTKHFSGWGTFFPNERWFPLMKSLGIKIVVNSDAHEPGLINSGRPEAIEALKKAGYDTVMELHRNRKQGRQKSPGTTVPELQSGKGDSDPRPQPWQGCALTN